MSMATMINKAIEAVKAEIATLEKEGNEEKLIEARKRLDGLYEALWGC